MSYIRFSNVKRHMVHKFKYLTPLLLVLVNLLLKLLFISSTSIGGDEPFSIYHAQMNISSIINQLTTGNNPPLYEILLHYWISIFGISEFWVRVPSVIFSSLTVLFIYKIGKKCISYEVGLIASLLFTFSNFNLLLAHEARVYSLFAFFTTASMYYFLMIIKQSDNTKNFIKLLTVNLFVIYLHYFGLFIIIIQSIICLFSNNIRRLILKKYLLYALLLFLLYIPNIRVLIVRFYDSSVHGTWVSTPNGIASLYGMIRTFANQPLNTIVCLFLFLSSIILYAIKRKKEEATLKNIILLWFLFPYFFMFIISYWIPMFLDRYLLFISSAFYLLIAFLSVSFFTQKKYNYIVPSIIIVLFIVTFNPNMTNKRNVRETIAKTIELKNDSTKVIVSPITFIPNFVYYFDKKIFKDVDCVNVYNKIIKNLTLNNIYALNSMDTNLYSAKKIIFVDAACSFGGIDNNIFNSLNGKYKLKNTYKYYEIFNVFEFERP